MLWATSLVLALCRLSVAVPSCPPLGVNWGYQCTQGYNFNSTCTCGSGLYNGVNGTVTATTCMSYGDWYPQPQACVEPCEFFEGSAVRLVDCCLTAAPDTPVEVFRCGLDGDFLCVTPGTVCSVTCNNGEDGEGGEDDEVPLFSRLACNWRVSPSGISAAWNVTPPGVFWQACHSAEEEACEPPFHSLTSEDFLTLPQVIGVVSVVLLGGVILEVLFHFAEHRWCHGRERALAFLNSLRHEFFVVGLLAFCLYLTFNSCDLNISPDVKELLEAIHMILFVWILVYHAMFVYLVCIYRTPFGSLKPAAYKPLQRAAAALPVLRGRPQADVDRYLKFCAHGVGRFMLERAGFAYLLSAVPMMIMLSSEFDVAAAPIIFASTMVLAFLLFVVCACLAPRLVSACRREPVDNSNDQLTASLLPPDSMGKDAVETKQDAPAHASVQVHASSVKEQVKTLAAERRTRRGPFARAVWVMVLYLWGASTCCAAVVATLSTSGLESTSTVVWSTIVDFVASSAMVYKAAEVLTRAEILAGIVDEHALLRALEPHGHGSGHHQ